MKKLILLFILIMLPLVNAQIAIQSFSSVPDKILPGEKLRLSITLENFGDDTIENILVNLDLSQVPFAPLGSSSEQAINEIKKNNDKTVSFQLVALPNAESKIYKVPVEIFYNTTKKASLISLEIDAKTNLDLILESTDLVKINDKGKVNIKFVNDGLAQIKFLKVNLQDSPAYEILSTKSIYLGEVDVDDFESEEFVIIPKEKNPQLLFSLEYKDVNNNEFKENKIINLNIYTEEEATKLGLVNKNFNWLFVSLFFLVLILIYIYRRKKKNVI